MLANTVTAVVALTALSISSAYAAPAARVLTQILNSIPMRQRL